MKAQNGKTVRWQAINLIAFGMEAVLFPLP